MENNFLKNLYAAIDVYHGYIKIAQETGERIVPFDHLLKIGEGLSGLKFYPYINLLKEMDKENKYIAYYDELKKENKDLSDRVIIAVAFEDWVKDCEAQQIISLAEKDTLLTLLSELNKSIDESEITTLLNE